MKKIETKWQDIWAKNNAFKAFIDESKPKYYVLEMLPYPSGRIHVGHLRNYSIGDCFARFMRAKGYNVLHPMGWDAFGLPAENAAISNNLHPSSWTYQNIDIMRKQLQAVGLSYDWDREITSCDPKYYVHEQNFFLELYKRGIAYQKESLVNFDPVDQTVLANEQVIDGRGWRSGAIVERRKLKQWFLKITNYAEELLKELDNLPGWPEKVRTMQEKWIGKSEGLSFDFALKDSNKKLSVFSTRPETIFGASFVAISYNHPLVAEIISTKPEIAKDIENYGQYSIVESELSKTPKQGVDTGLKVFHPIKQDVLLPLVIANYVMLDYGTGAIFGCPAHDERDLELANVLNLPFVSVISDDIMSNSDFLDNLSIQQARKKIIEYFEELSIGKRTINYRLRDWGVSRQRFWGCPIPIIYCDSCGVVPVPEVNLPISLPLDVIFDGKGNPLDNHPTWKHVNCPNCNQMAVRETDTLDTFFESSWYFARYCNNYADQMTDQECDYWLPVDQYIGGVEHAVMHLLYARFFTKLMYEHDYVKVKEPFTNLLTQGMVLHSTYIDNNGNFVYPNEVIKENDSLVHKVTKLPVSIGKLEKMSKSKKNAVDLEAMLDQYGADVLRLFVLSDSPVEKDLEWSTNGLDGALRFITKLYNLVDEIKPIYINSAITTTEKDGCSLLYFTHFTIKHVSEEIQHFKLNRAIARIRELFNKLCDYITLMHKDNALISEVYRVLLKLSNPFIPHITEEIWQILTNELPLYNSKWPSYNEQLLVLDSCNIAIQVNGKLRLVGNFSIDLTKEELTKKVLSLPEVTKHTEGREVKKVIFVVNKLINIVI